MQRFTTRRIEKIDNGKPYWDSNRVGVFDGDNQIGEYTRNYHSFASSTFYAFEQDEKWYALYSPNYTATRIMNLPDCKDIGGEESCGHGFCPVEFYVPEITGQIYNPDDPPPRVANHYPEKWALKVVEGKYYRYYFPDDPNHPQPDEARKAEYLAEKAKSHKASEEWFDRNPYFTQYARFGFVAGCVWGDDSSLKLQFIDLTRASEGIIVRDERFDYLELPNGVNLNDAIDFRHDFYLNDPFDKIKVMIAVPTVFDLTGKKY